MEAVIKNLRGLDLIDYQKNQRYSDLESMGNEMQRQQENVARSAKQKGKKPTHRVPALLLIANHRQSLIGRRNLEKSGNVLHQTIISSEHRPSNDSFSKLQPIRLKDMRVEIVHEDAYIVLKTIVDPLRRTALSTVVIDCEGTVDLLSLYNINVGLDDDAFLPRNTYLVLRAPYYKLSASGHYTIRSDHPSDVHKINAAHPLVKAFPWTSDPPLISHKHTPLDLKEMGNDLYREGHYHAAVEKYTTAIESAALDKDSDLCRKLYCNRANGRLRLSQFDGAVRDCDEAVRRFPNDSKAFFLKGRALYSLGSYGAAKSAFQRCLAVNQDSAEGREHLMLASKRVEESKTGKFDFNELQRMADTLKYPRLECGTYIGPVEIRQCSTAAKGRGVFATRDIAQGELLICEKAFMANYKGESDISMTINTVRNRLYVGPDSVLPGKITQYLYDNPSIATQYLNLYSGGRDQPRPDIQFTPEGAPIIDAFTVAAILDYNAVRPENAADLMSATVQRNDGPDSDGGIWLHTSYLNHSCTGNVFRTFIGDIAILRAVRSIKAGEELHHTYVPPLNSFKAREKAISKYSFTCLCELCQLQRGVPSGEAKHRKKALRSFQDFARQLRAAPPPNGFSAITRTRSFVKAIRKTYSKPRLCIDLLQPYALLSTLQYSAGKKAQCVEDLTEVITLVSGANARNLEKFEPLIWTPELMLLLLSLCVVLEDVGSKEAISHCKDATRRLWGIASGLGYEDVAIDDVIRIHRKRLEN